MKKRISEHKQAVRKFVDKKYGIDVNVLHKVDWETARITATLIQKAIVIQSNANTMNLDRGLTLSNLWLSSLELPPITGHNIFLFLPPLAQSIYLFPVVP